MGEPFAVLLISGAHERAHYAFVLAAAAAAMGRPALVFATNEGCRALTLAPPDAATEAALRTKGVATLAELRDACAELGVRLLACDAGLRIAGLDPAELLPGVEVAGIPTLLDASRGGQVVTL